MKRLCLSLIPTLLTVLLAACSPAKPTFALLGVPERYSYTDSANLLFDNGACSYVIYRGNSVTPPEVVTPCTLLKDEKDALGNPHWNVEIQFDTAKGPQTLLLHATGKNNETAKSVPDIGVYLPKDWAQAEPAPKLMLKSTDAGKVYSNMTIHVGGIRCSLEITAIANGDTASNMPCGLAYWSDTSISVVIPGALISTAYTSQGWPLSFVKDATSGNWKLVKVPSGFPSGYAVSADTATAPAPAPAAGT
ncbi:MAG TPA: hypothetical protein VFX47_02040 [Gammaproteobacteria bacterium]|nr:hypothetical protein [Gammaproteobacteria bacterium]